MPPPMLSMAPPATGSIASFGMNLLYNAEPRIGRLTRAEDCFNVASVACAEVANSDVPSLMQEWHLIDFGDTIWHNYAHD